MSLIGTLGLLPPPPLPDASTGVGLWQIGLIFALVIGAVGMIAFAIKPVFSRQVTDAPVMADAVVMEPVLMPPPRVEIPQEPIAAPVTVATPASPAATGRLRRLVSEETTSRRRMGEHGTGALDPNTPLTSRLGSLSTGPLVDPASAPTPLSEIIAAEPAPKHTAEFRDRDWDAELFAGLAPVPGAEPDAAEPIAQADIPPATPEPEPVVVEAELDPYVKVLTGMLKPVAEERRGVTMELSLGVDQSIADGALATVRELVFCANLGQFLNGFALYSDAFLFRTMDESGMSEDEFRETYENIPARDREEWLEVRTFTDVTRLPDGKVTAIVTMGDRHGNPIPGAERYRFAQDSRSGLWQIDDIESI